MNSEFLKLARPLNGLNINIKYIYHYLSQKSDKL